MIVELLIPASVRLLGVQVHPVNTERAQAIVMDWMADRGQHVIVTPNAEIVMTAQRDVEFCKILNEADLAIPDGQSVVNALRSRLDLSQRREIEKVSGRQLAQDLCAIAAANNWRVFLLGAAAGVAARAAGILQTTYPGLQIAGTYAGRRESAADAQTVATILALSGGGPIDLLLVAFGAPYQEKWLQRNLPQLPGVKVAMAVGGTFDVLAGLRPQPPDCMARHGLEWLFRLLQEPRRLGRMLKLPQFVTLAWLEKLGFIHL